MAMPKYRTEVSVFGFFGFGAPSSSISVVCDDVDRKIVFGGCQREVSEFSSKFHRLFFDVSCVQIYASIYANSNIPSKRLSCIYIYCDASKFYECIFS
jgi:hypothetical protein